MSNISNKIHLAEYMYDFAVDGGTKDANIVLSTLMRNIFQCKMLQVYFPYSFFWYGFCVISF